MRYIKLLVVIGVTAVLHLVLSVLSLMFVMSSVSPEPSSNLMFEILGNFFGVLFILLTLPDHLFLLIKPNLHIYPSTFVYSILAACIYWKLSSKKRIS